MSKQLKRKVDIRCLQEVRWRGQGARYAAIKGRRCKWYWFGSNNGIGVGILVQEELCEKVVEVRRKCVRMMTTVLVFKEEVIRVICAYAPSAREINL